MQAAVDSLVVVTFSLTSVPALGATLRIDSPAPALDRA
jgi:hypothetical protein